MPDRHFDGGILNLGISWSCLMSPEDSGAQFSMLETCGTLRKLPQSRSAYLCDLLRPALGWPPSSLFLGTEALSQV